MPRTDRAGIPSYRIASLWRQIPRRMARYLRRVTAWRGDSAQPGKGLDEPAPGVGMAVRKPFYAASNVFTRKRSKRCGRYRGRFERRDQVESAGGAKFQGIGSRIVGCDRYAHPTSLWNKQRSKLQREPDKDSRTASPVAKVLSLASPLREPIGALGVHESFDLAGIHTDTVKANPVRGDELSSHESGERQPEEDEEPDNVQGQSERVEYLRQEHVKLEADARPSVPATLPPGKRWPDPISKSGLTMI